ncbi:MAG: hypothetical protein ACREQY_12540, partial [Candidatus Binatia bacterium]
RLYDLLELGDAASADVEIERIEELARALRQPRYLADAETIRAMRALMQGNFDEGAAIARRALTLNQQVRPEIAATLYGSQMFRTVWRERGQFAELETGVKAILDQVGPMPAVSSAFAFVSGELGKGEEARAEFERSATDDFASIPCERAWTAVMANLAEVCCFLSDLPRAAVLYAELLPFAAMNVVLGPLPHAVWGPIAHFLGMLAATMGEEKKAAEQFEYALKIEARMRMPAMRARTQYDYGRMLVRSRSPDDVEKGAELLAAALETARSFGMNVLEEKVSALVVECSSQHIESVSEAGTETAAESARDLFRREGKYWAIAYEGQAFRLRYTKGLVYLTELLRNPGREFFALDLAQAGEVYVGGDSRRLAAGLAVSGNPGDAGPLLDSQAKAEYRRRLESLREELEDAERSNHSERAAKAREEIGFLTEELARATGLGGRDRKAASAVERARQSVTIAIRTTVKRISKNSPALGRHLASTVKTGKFCVYAPDPRSASSWTL